MGTLKGVGGRKLHPPPRRQRLWRRRRGPGLVTQKEGLEDQGPLEQLEGGPLALLPILGPPGLPSGLLALGPGDGARGAIAGGCVCPRPIMHTLRAQGFKGPKETFSLGQTKQDGNFTE